jgi:hypothetical protein
MQTGNACAEAIFNPTVCTLPLHSPLPLKTLNVPQFMCKICLSQSHKITQLEDKMLFQAKRLFSQALK